MSGEIGTQSKASCAGAAMEGFRMRFEVLAGVMLAVAGRASTYELTCSDLRCQNA